MNDELHLSASGANGIGQRTALTDPSGSTQWNYNARGLPITATKTISGAGSFTTRHYYDAQERVITTTYPTGEVVTQTYNAQGLLETVRSPTHNQAYASNLDYNALGQVKRIDLGNTVLITYAYFGDGSPWDSAMPSFRLWRSLTSRSGTALLDLHYSHDAVGNINHTLSPTANEEFWYSYDQVDRLTGVSGSYTETYAYNPVGNLLSQQASGGPPITYTYGVTQPHAVRALSNGGQFTYDRNGNTPALLRRRLRAVQV